MPSVRKNSKNTKVAAAKPVEEETKVVDIPTDEDIAELSAVEEVEEVDESSAVEETEPPKKVIVTPAARLIEVGLKLLETEEIKLAALRDSIITANVVITEKINRAKNACNRALTNRLFVATKDTDLEGYTLKAATIENHCASKVTVFEAELIKRLAGVDKRIAIKEEKIRGIRSKSDLRIKIAKHRAANDPKNMTATQAKSFHQRERKRLFEDDTGVKTSTGMPKTRLMQRANGRVVSTKKSQSASKSPWILALAAAREKLGVKGFVPCGGKTEEGQKLLAFAREFHVEFKAEAAKKKAGEGDVEETKE